MLQYIIEVSICWSVLISIFYLFLRKVTYFRFNRWYLLNSVLLGLLLPLLRFLPNSIAEQSVQVIYKTAPLAYTIKNAPAQVVQFVEESASGFELTMGLLIFYLLGLTFFSLRLINGLIKIRQLYNSGTKKSQSHFTLIETNIAHLPFSFMNCVFISKTVELHKELDQVIKHEMEHIKNFHTLDILFLEIITVAFWFNPLVYIYKIAIRQTHEYLADHAVLKETSKKEYGHILLDQSLSGFQLALTHHFYHSHLKKRIEMMYRKKSGKWVLSTYILTLPLLIFMAIIFTGQTSGINYQLTETGDSMMADTLPEGTPLVEEVFVVVEKMPLFPGSRSIEESNRLVQRYITDHLKYPETARKNKVNGRVLTQFMIDIDGSVTGAQILKGIGSGCDEEALRIIESMNTLPSKWTPGRQRGKNVRVIYRIPIIFKLGEKPSSKSSQKSFPIDAENAIFKTPFTGNELILKNVNFYPWDYPDELPVVPGQHHLNYPIGLFAMTALEFAGPMPEITIDGVVQPDGLKNKINFREVLQLDELILRRTSSSSQNEGDGSILSSIEFVGFQ